MLSFAGLSLAARLDGRQSEAAAHARSARWWVEAMGAPGLGAYVMQFVASVQAIRPSPSG